MYFLHLGAPIIYKLPIITSCCFLRSILALTLCQSVGKVKPSTLHKLPKKFLGSYTFCTVPDLGFCSSYAERQINKNAAHYLNAPHSF